MEIGAVPLAVLLPLAFLGLFEAPLTAAAVAGGAVSIPIIIHLLNRKRFRVVTWAAMRFLLAAQRKNSRKMRLEQLILLGVRCLMVLLLVLAMASVTPWAEAVWRGPKVVRKVRHTAEIVLDRLGRVVAQLEVFAHALA